MMPLIHNSKRQFSALCVRRKSICGYRSTTESFMSSILDRNINDTLKENRLGGLNKGVLSRNSVLTSYSKSSDSNFRENKYSID